MIFFPFKLRESLGRNWLDVLTEASGRSNLSDKPILLPASTYASGPLLASPPGRRWEAEPLKLPAQLGLSICPEFGLRHLEDLGCSQYIPCPFGNRTGGRNWVLAAFEILAPVLESVQFLNW